MAAKFGIGWRQVGACFVLLAIGAMITAAYSVVAVPLSQEFHPSRMVLMLAMTILSGVTGLLSPLLGARMDRSSLRQLMVIGAISLIIGFTVLSFATSFTQVLIIYGLFMAPANVLIGPMAASVLISRWFSKRRGAALGIAISGVAMGGFLFPPLMQTLLDHFHWREAFRIISAIVAFCTLPAVALVVNRPGDRGLYPDGESSDQMQSRAATTASVPELSTRDLLSDRTFWCAAIMFAVILSGMKGMVTNLVPLALDEGIPASEGAFLISIYAAFAAVAKLGFAAVADRVNLRSLMFISLAGFAIGAGCLTRADAGYWLIAGGVGLIGLFGGVMVPLQGLLIPRIYGNRVVGRVGGLLNLVVLVGMLSTPPIFGLIFDKTGSYSVIFTIFAGLSAVTMLVVPYIRLSPRDEVKGSELGEPVLTEQGKA